MNGRSQAVRIPKAFEMTGEAVMVYRDGARLVMEPVEEDRRLLDILAGMEPMEADFPDIDTGLPALDDIRL